MMRYQRISADDHMDLNWLPRDLWTKRVPQQFKDRAPKVVDTEVGPRWMYEGDDWGRWGGGGMYSEFFARVMGALEGPQPTPTKRSGPGGGAFERAGIAVDETELRCWDTKLRLQDLDRDGHDAQVIYTLPFPLMGPDRALD